MAESGWWTPQELIVYAAYGAAIGAEVGAVVLDNPRAIVASKIVCPLGGVVLAGFGVGYGPIFNAKYHVRGGLVLFPTVSLVWGVALGALLVAFLFSWPGTVVGLAVGYLAAGQLARPRPLKVVVGGAVLGSVTYALWTGPAVSAGAIGRAAAIGALGGPMSILLYALVGSLFVRPVRDE
jgi:hypothetical protein